MLIRKKQHNNNKNNNNNISKTTEQQLIPKKKVIRVADTARHPNLIVLKNKPAEITENLLL